MQLLAPWHNVGLDFIVGEAAVITIGFVCSGPHTVYHARFQPHPPGFLVEVPVTEVMTSYFPANYSADDQNKYHNLQRNFSRHAEQLMVNACQAPAIGYMKCRKVKAKS